MMVNFSPHIEYFMHELLTPRENFSRRKDDFADISLQRWLPRPLLTYGDFMRDATRRISMPDDSPAAARFMSLASRRAEVFTAMTSAGPSNDFAMVGQCVGLKCCID